MISDLIDILQFVFDIASDMRGREGALTHEEIEILSASAQTGELRILWTDVQGPWLRAGSIHFFRPGNPPYEARYLEAFERLRKRGFVRDDAGQVFRLTESGVKKAGAISPRPTLCAPE